MSWLFYNDSLVEKDNFRLDGSNRAFRYGDGIFESIRCAKGEPLCFDLHYKRILSSLKLLKIQLHSSHNQDFFYSSIRELLIANQHTAGARIRLSVFRAPGGLYLAKNNNAHILIESSPLEQLPYTLNKKGLLVGVYPDIRKPSNFLSRIKSCNSLIYVLASEYGNRKRWDDVLLINESDALAEASSSNVFMIKDGRLFTPALDQDCVAGIMREVVLVLAKKMALKPTDCVLMPDDLLDADEVFLTNAVNGIRWVKGYKARRFYHEISQALLEALNKQLKLT